MKIWHIGDTHSYHHLLTIPDDVDMIIHSGDFSNYYNVYKNEPEARDFLNWYAALEIKHKILIAGNHDALPFHRNREFRETCKKLNIIYLENESVIIDGIKIWGSPHTPQFGNWYFMKNRIKLYRVWQNIPDDTDIVVVHGPPRNKLDLSYNYKRQLEFCGCSALDKRIKKINPKLVCFGHIHDSERIINGGVVYEDNIFYSNGSVVKDGSFGKLVHNGNLFKLNNNKINIINE